MHKLAISPCPNDTFAFYGLLHGKTAYRGRLETTFADIEELNRLCLEGHVDFCKISFGVYPAVQDRYRLLEAGSALGFGCGPLVVARHELSRADLAGKRIAIPGRHTTAALLLDLYLDGDYQPVEMVFDRIMPACAAGEVDAGLIIHESRFTYDRHGLSRAVDLGEWWEHETGHPIPLGGIVARRDLDPAETAAFDAALTASIDYAHAHDAEVERFMRLHAAEIERDVMQRHVALYVNAFTRGLGARGRAAIEDLAERAAKLRG
ncbi:1,4-dihydroxy-6-naphtoate synthase [Sulfidibacter corallicola]|uniref:1,4-dihydroxy-6-naphtoate synthase n=1 Tax=Sulfidibacter corallicola TaxID=2818388 RepID=A0A8A4TW45_SULCO|nr:1,4-dihydroxy-6-naphthoate synthase [Sulfidibacter corallicola]QTD53577.1 1,4-dihydroxy-6-naphthoate synthase [Sulfidibacter corallicola]